jgi:hypothetical protein
MELNSGPKIANSTCGKTIDVETIDRDSTVLTYRSLACITTKEETNVLKIFEQKIVRNLYRPIIGRECWRIRKNEIKDVLQGQIL